MRLLFAVLVSVSHKLDGVHSLLVKEHMSEIRGTADTARVPGSGEGGGRARGMIGHLLLAKSYSNNITIF